jgi:hypothetical protein
MSRRASVKGSVFSGVIEEVRKLLANGDLSRGEAARRLEPGDLELLDSSISIAGWYDVGAFVRLNELLRDVRGGGSNEYLRDLGRESAQRLLDGGLYSQMEYLSRTQTRQATDPRARYEAFGRDLRRITTLSGSIYSFSKWSVEADPEHPLRYIVVVSDAKAFTDVICWRALGFMNQVVAVARAARGAETPSDLWLWERVAADLVRFRMLLDA